MRTVLTPTPGYPQTFLEDVRELIKRCVGAHAIALAVLIAQPAAAASITIHTERSGDTIDIHASVILNADGATAWRVLTDYNRYPEFIPDLHLSRVVSRHQATVTVEQSGIASFWLIRIPLDSTFEIGEKPPDRLMSHAVAGSLRSLASNYALSPAATGVRLDYDGHIAPGYALFGRIEQSAVEQNVARQFKALADEIDRQSAALVK